MRVDAAERAPLHAVIEHLERQLQVLLRAVDALTRDVPSQRPVDRALRQEPFVLRSMSSLPIDACADNWSAIGAPRPFCN